MAKRPTDPQPSDVVSANPSEAFTCEGKTYRVHWLALLFPRLQGPAFARLVESIRVHGLQQPIVVMGSALDIIVDGVNRFLAALEAGVKLQFKELPPGRDPVDYIETANMHRRDLTVSQRAALAARIRQYRADQAHDANDQPTDSLSAHGSSEPDQQPVADDRPGTGQPSLPPSGHDSTGRASSAQPAAHAPPDPVRSRPDGADHAGDSNKRVPTQKAIATSMGVSEAQVRKAERVRERAPELDEAVVDGTISVHDAFGIREKPPEVRAQALADVKAGNVKKLKQAVEKRQATADTAGKGTAVRTTRATDSTAGDTPTVESAQSGAGSRRQDVDDAATDPGTSPEVTGGRKGSAANPANAKSEAADAPAAADAEPRLPSTSPAASDEQREHPVVESSGIGLAPEIAEALKLALGDIDVAVCSAAAVKHGVRARHRHDPAHAEVPKPWPGCVLLVPPTTRLEALSTTLLSELTAGHVQRAAMLAPLDPAVDLFDAEQLDLLVLERRAPRVPGSRIGTAQTPRTALFLFGVTDLTSDLLATLAPWGQAFRPAAGKRSQMKTIVTDVAASARGLWGHFTNRGGTSPEE